MPSSYYKIGKDVYGTEEGKLNLDQFQSLGLNYNLLGEGQANAKPLDTGRDVETRSFIAGGGQLGQASAAQSAGYSFDPTTGQLTTPQGQGSFGAGSVPTTEAIGAATTTLADKLKNEGAVTTSQLPAEQTNFYKTMEDRLKQSDDYVSQLMSLYVPTAQEQKIQADIDTTLGSAEAGINQEADRPATMGFITGAQASIERRANAKLAGLQRELTRLQGNREGQQKAIAAAFDIKRQSVQDALQFYKTFAPEKIAVDENSGTVYFHNPVTGEVTATKLPGYQPPAEKPQAPIEVSPGATLYDPVTGRSIFTAPTAKQLGGTNVSGGGGTTTSPTIPTNLTAAQKTDVADMKTLLGQLDSIDEVSELKGAVGFFTGPIESAALKLFGKGSESDAEIRAIIGNVKAQLAKLRGGTSFTENEQKLLESYVPSINESPESIVAKVRALRTYVSSKLSQTYSTSGGSTESTADPLNLFK